MQFRYRIGATSFANVGVGADGAGPVDGGVDDVLDDFADDAESAAAKGMTTSVARPSPTEVWMRMRGNSTVS